jgi:hypothetical protein
MALTLRLSLMLVLVIPSALMASGQRKGKGGGECKQKKSPCADGSHPTCSDASKPDDHSKPPTCQDGSEPLCQDGSSPQPPDQLKSTGNSDDVANRSTEDDCEDGVSVMKIVIIASGSSLALLCLCLFTYCWCRTAKRDASIHQMSQVAQAGNVMHVVGQPVTESTEKAASKEVV